MKNIPLKTVEVDIEGTTTKLSYKAQLKEIMRIPADGRLADLNEVRKSLRVLDALDAADGELKLEDADFDYLKQRVINAKWPIINRYILQFVEDVTEPK